ncbi:MAG: DUF1003 domain-containing protein [Bacteroidetes bacterium]|nr:DUF1003 domain-containing protein [Bacteroidota bacterium]MBS1539670.1 DUF1003 domain-containing protein [Bacteroidota bacterium]
MKTFVSDISKKEYSASEKISAKTIRPSILATIQRENPAFDLSCYLSVSELNKFRQKYIGDYLMREIGELNELEQTVLGALKGHNIITDKVEDEWVDEYTFGQKMADKVASFGGSWKFILLFIGFLLVWVAFNTYLYINRPFDPYPFILLNLILSCLAALQAPVIMMSQNRQNEKDRERARKDYMINLKSELEIRMVHEKLDHLIIHQQHEMLEIQKVQVEMMNDIMTRMK